MADNGKAGNKVITRDFTSPDLNDPEEARRQFQYLVQDLGRHRYYPNTEYVDFNGNVTTVAQELKNVREVYASSDSPGVREMAKLPDPQLLQKLRERGEAKMGAGDKEDLELVRRRQKAFDVGVGS